jgi:hypothetical protein
MRSEPFAFTIYREHVAGKSIAQLSFVLSIPPERVTARLKAARQCLERVAREPHTAKQKITKARDNTQRCSAPAADNIRVAGTRRLSWPTTRPCCGTT